MATWRPDFLNSSLSRSIVRWLHDTVGELLGCHYFMGQWVGSGLFDGFVGRRVIIRLIDGSVC